MHNGAEYGWHIFIKYARLAGRKVDCIPCTNERYISFTIDFIAYTFTNKDGELVQIKRKLRFIDSLRLLNRNLEAHSNVCLPTISEQ